MKEDILAGLKNAIERGVSLEEAIQSFVNAGYNEVEVKEAASSLTLGASTIIQEESKSQKETKSTSFFGKTQKPILQSSREPIKIKPEEQKIMPQPQSQPQAQQIDQHQNLNSWEGEPPSPESNQILSPPNQKSIQEMKAQGVFSQPFQPKSEQPKHSSATKVLLIIIPIILIIVGGVILFLLFGEQIIDFFANLL